MTSSPIASPAVTFARRKEDASVTELEKQAKKISPWVFTSILSMMGQMCIISALMSLMLGICLSAGRGSGWSATTFVTPMVFVGLGTVLLALASDKKKRVEKKSVKRGIQASRQTAKSLGEDVVPVLTKEHVEARINIDAALRTKLDEKGGKWSQPNSDRIGILLFQDLMQESIISSLILERGITNASGIESALHLMQTESVTPIQEGWL